MPDAPLPELKEIVGAMLFVRKAPLSAEDVLKALRGAAERLSGPARDFAAADEARVREAFAEVGRALADARLGFRLAEVAGGWRLENDAACGPWLRVLLQKGRGTKLSPAALETLAIIAYRQPCARSEIEGVRGVAVDAILKNLLELQLVRVAGRSDLPGRPWLFGTTRKFLEHFGLRSLDDLPDAGELRRRSSGPRRSSAADRRAAAETLVDAPPAPAEPDDPRQLKIALVEEAAPRVATPAERAAAALSEDPPPDAWLDRDDRGLDDLAAAPFDNGTDVPQNPQPQEPPNGEIH